MTTGDPFALSRSDTWDGRVAAVPLLAAALGSDTAAFERLTEMLDDENTGVGYQAALALIDHGGPAGMAEVLRAGVIYDVSVTSWMWDALRTAWIDGGFTLDAPLTELRDHHPDQLIRDTAREALRDVCKIPQE